MFTQKGRSERLRTPLAHNDVSRSRRGEGGGRSYDELSMWIGSEKQTRIHEISREAPQNAAA